MREKRKGRKLISRIFAGLICAVLVATLLPGLPGGRSNAADFPAGTVSVEVYKGYLGIETDFINGELKDAYKLKSSGSPNISVRDQLMHIITLDNNGGALTAGTYTISLSDVIKVNHNNSSTGNITLRGVDKNDSSITVECGSVSWTTGTSVLTVALNGNISQVSDLAFGLGCALNDNAGNNASNGEIEITIPATSTTLKVKVDEFAPGTEVTYPGITKSNGGDLATVDGTASWSIDYTGYADGAYGGTAYPTGNVPKYIVDVLPEGMDYVPGSAKVGGVAVSASDISYDSSTRTLKYTISEALGKTDFQFTFDTVLTTTAKKDYLSKTVSNWDSGAAWSFENNASLKKANGIDDVTDKNSVPITADSTVNVTLPAVPTETAKTGVFSGTDGTNSKVDWTVTVDPKVVSSKFTKFVIEDTLGAGLVYPTDAATLGVKVNGATVSSVTADISNSSQRKILFDLSSYVNSSSNTGAPFTLTYTTSVDAGLYDSTYTKDDIKNSADLDWAIDLGGGVTAAKKSTDTGTKVGIPTGMGSLDVVPIAKKNITTNSTFNWADRKITWEIEFGSTNVIFQKIVIEDELEIGSQKGKQNFIDPLTPVANRATAVAAAEAKIKAAVEAALDTAGYSNYGSAVTVTITEAYDKNTASKVKIVVDGTAGTTPMGNIDKKAKFQMESYVSSTTWLVGNHTGANNSNKAKITTESLLKNGSNLTKPYEASASVGSNGKMFTKRATKFDPTTGVIDWEIVINQKNANVGNFVLYDKIPDGLIYKANSTKLGGAAYTDYSENIDIVAGEPYQGWAQRWFLRHLNNVTGLTPGQAGTYVDGQNVIFSFANITTGPQTLTYQTVVDINSDIIKNTNGDVAFKNTLSSYAEDAFTPGIWDETEGGSEDASATINNKILDKTETTAPGDKETTQRAKYSVTINPNSLQLLPPGSPAASRIVVRDTLPSGLILDKTTVKVYKGTVSAATNSGSGAADFRSASTVTKGADDTANAKPDYNFVDNILTLTLEDKQPYVVEYEVEIIKYSSDLNNRISLSGTVIDEEASNQTQDESFSFMVMSKGTLRMSSALASQLGIEQLLIKKVDKANAANLLSGAKFEVYASKTGSPIGTGESGADGIANIIFDKSKVTGSKIYYKEVASPSGYKLDMSWHEIDYPLPALTGDAHETIENEAETGPATVYVKIKKVDDTTAKDAVKGAVFELFDDNAGAVGTTTGKTATTDDAGEIYFTGVTAGNKYWVKETTVPTGYSLKDSGKDTFGPITASTNPETAKIVITNHKEGSTTPPPGTGTTPPGTGTTPPASGTTPPAGGGTSGTGGGGGTSGGGGGTSGGGGGGSRPLSVPPVTVPGPVLSTTQTDPAPTVPTAPAAPEGTPETPAVTPEGTPVVEGAPEAPVASAVTVTFQTELGDTPTPQTMTPGQVAYNPGAPLDPASLKPGMVINGQRFEGWYTDPEFKNAYKFGTPVTEDMVLYAKWTKVGGAGKSPKTADNNWILLLLIGAAGVLSVTGIRLVKSKQRDRFS